MKETQDNLTQTFNEGYTTRRSQFLKSTPQPHRPSPSTLPSLPQNRTLSCKFHPNNNLHTFCLSPNCMLPMCSTCISIHNEDHEELKTYGNYKNLDELIGKAMETMEEQQSMIEELSADYVEDYQKKRMIQGKCRDVLEKNRIKVHEEIDRVYDRYLIDIKEKINQYNQQIQQLYGGIEEALHLMHSELNANREGLSAFNKDTSSPSSNNKLGRTNRPQLFSFTPENTNMGYRQYQQKQRLETKKEDRKIMKILIEHYSNNLSQVNYSKIAKIRKQINQLKQFDFVVNLSWQKTCKYLANLCKDTIQVRSSANQGEERVKYKNNGEAYTDNVNLIPSQSSLSSKEEIGEIMKNTNQRMAKMQLYANPKQSPTKFHYMGREKPQAK